jgi:periplasmic protein TonB
MLPMRKILFTAFLLLATYTKAQDTTAISQQDDENKIYENSGIEFQPEYPGGMAAFYTFIGKNYVYPKGRDIQGKIIVSFVVEKDGWLSDFRIIRDLGFDTGGEAIRVLKRCKRWKAGVQNGRKVRCSYVLPIVLQASTK